MISIKESALIINMIYQRKRGIKAQMNIRVMIAIYVPEYAI